MQPSRSATNTRLFFEINLDEIIWINAFKQNRTEQIRRDSSIPALRGSVGIFEFKHTNAPQDGSGRSFPVAVICLHRAAAINSSTRSSVKVHNPVRRAAANHLPAGAGFFFL